jgi:Fe-S cluster assembly protein SufD
MSFIATLERSKRDREDWKYTSLKALADIGFALSPEKAPISTQSIVLPSIFADSVARHQIVFANGVFQSELSQFGELPFDILSGDAKEGYRLTLAGKTCLVTAPVELVFLGADIGKPTETATRLAIELGESGRLTLIEHHPAACTTDMVHVVESTIRLGKQAKLVHGKIVNGGDNASHLACTQVEIAEGAYYDNFTLIRGGRLVRNEIDTNLAGKMAQCALNGAMLLRGTEHADTTTRITHAAPLGSSRESYKTVLAGKSRGVFQGKITVAEGAQKTDGRQMSRALLLSDQAEMDAKPELEIYADDVKCSHGCTTGDLDPEAMFYLRARGLSEDAARGLLIRGFIDEILDEIHMPEWRDFCRAQVEEWLDEQR